VGNANTTYYVIANQSASEWEVGIGTYTSSGTTLSRDTVLSSSNSGSLVDFSAGTKDVFVDYPAGRAVYEDAAGNVDGYPITGGTINNTTIGATTPAAGTFTTLIGGGGSANYFQTQGSATTKAVEAKALGSDTNIAFVIDSKGTGAIDLAAGSSGVNISNGGTVTAITRTATGSLYTGFPSLAISAPTTAGGVQATASPQLVAANTTIVGGGTGYTVNDVLTVTTGGGSGTINITVTTVSAGVITAATASSAALTTIPSGTVSVSGGTGTGATFTLIYVIAATFTITNAGSGYVEQPTVTFSGGGGSGAAAYATVGGGVVIRSIGVNTAVVTNQAITFETVGSSSSRPAFVIRDISTGDSWYQMGGGSTNTFLIAKGNTNANAYLGASGGGSVRFTTSGDSINEQMRVSHTASAVNYVQVTGAATTAAPLISVQGSDANVAFGITSKGTSAINFLTNSGNQRQLQINHTASAVNYFALTGSAAGSAPAFSVAGTDTNIDLTLTPKGTGNVRFGTYTANMALTIQGYVEIKDSGGTVRRLAVVA
jgi:hypothetical protein